MGVLPIPMAVAQVVRSALWQIRDAAAQRGIAVETRLPEDELEIWADERAVGQVLHNLLSNALKFTAEGGTVTVSAAAAPNGGVEIGVADTGAGIPADRLADLMQPFEQVNTRYSRSTGGTGLGLSLVRGLVDLHRGRVGIRSTLHVGTTVTVYFPPRGDAAPE